MDIDLFRNRLKAHVDHVKRVGDKCSTEETTKQALILPLLDILGFSPYDPSCVLAEYAADVPGVKASERVDYALYCNDSPVMFVEAKSYKEALNNHAPQLTRYFNCTIGVTIAAITNGREWRFFTDLMHSNIMDEQPFLIIDFADESSVNYEQLYQFTRENFQANKLRTFAEESQYTYRFKQIVTRCVREVDADFVRYIAQQSNIQKQLTAKFLEFISPMVKAAVDQAIGEIVVNSLSGGQTVITTSPIPQTQAQAIEPPDFIVDPNNPKIITTKDELAILEIVRNILSSEEIDAKDTETYYSVLYQNRAHRWLLRYYGNKKIPTVEFAIGIDESRKKEIERSGLSITNGNHVIIETPNHLERLAGILFDCLAYCKNDDNFRKSTILTNIQTD